MRSLLFKLTPPLFIPHTTSIYTIHLFANSLRNLVGIKAVSNLQLLNKRNVLLLGLLRGHALIDNLLPRALLGLALEVEGAGCLGLLDRGVLGGLLEETVHFLCLLAVGFRERNGGVGRATYKEMVVGGLLDELLAVHDGLLEGGAESDHFVDRVMCSIDCQIFWKIIAACASFILP